MLKYIPMLSWQMRRKSMRAPGKSNLGAAADTSTSATRDVINECDTLHEAIVVTETQVSVIQSNEQIFPHWIANQYERNLPAEMARSP
jgi:hypothetical protein